MKPRTKGKRVKKDTQTAVELAGLLQRLVTKGFGPKCKEYNFGCVTCQAQRVATECRQLTDLYKVLDKS